MSASEKKTRCFIHTKIVILITLFVYCKRSIGLNSIKLIYYLLKCCLFNRVKPFDQNYIF